MSLPPFPAPPEDNPTPVPARKPPKSDPLPPVKPETNSPAVIEPIHFFVWCMRGLALTMTFFMVKIALTFLAGATGAHWMHLAITGVPLELAQMAENQDRNPRKKTSTAPDPRINKLAIRDLAPEFPAMPGWHESVAVHD